jgi:pimeloyl-ACP methyl ester carboxylesterase
LCVHGLTRNGRDFDALAERLARTRKVICPDMPGRGRSEWLTDSALYAVPQYVSDCVTLIARMNCQQVDWVGTSMGGLIGMALASMPGAPIARLVLNDIGPVLRLEGLRRIGTYVGKAPRFDRYEQCVAYTQQVSSGFGPHDAAGWDLLCRHYWIPDAGQWRVHYDPRIAEPFAALVAEPPPLWTLYDAIRCPTLVVRGSESDLLSAADAKAMTERGPRAQWVEVAGVGHAPTFIADSQSDVIIRFLEESVYE